MTNTIIPPLTTSKLILRKVNQLSRNSLWPDEELVCQSIADEIDTVTREILREFSERSE